MPEYSSTDADAMQLTAEGIPTMVLSIPQRYMHTPLNWWRSKTFNAPGDCWLNSSLRSKQILLKELFGIS
jgi:hypothetical protein